MIAPCARGGALPWTADSGCGVAGGAGALPPCSGGKLRKSASVGAAGKPPAGSAAAASARARSF